MLEIIKHLFELLPVVLAIVALYLLGPIYTHARRLNEKVSLLLMSLSSCLLIVTQLSWWTSYYIQNNSHGTALTNFLWTVFNICVVLSFIFYAKRK